MALAGLERTRLWPGAAEEAWRIWEGFVRSPYHRIYDYRYDKGCGHCRSRDFEHLLVTVNRK